MDDKYAEEAIITLLSMDSRIGIDKIAAEVGLTRDQVYGRIKKLVKEYGIRFVPEINIANLQRYEFLGMSWGKSKREILNMVTQESAPNIGFEEYVALVDFKGGTPSDEEILKAMGDSYIPQYIARMAGQHNLFVYAIARHATDITEFMYQFMNNIKLNSVDRVQFIYPEFGFFPLNDKILEQMQVQSQYKKLLLSLNKNAKVEFSSLTKEMGGITGATVGSLYARLKEIGLITRPTICITQPAESIVKLFLFSIVDKQKFVKNKGGFLLDFVKNRTNQCIFMASIMNPSGFLVLARFKSPLEEEEFKTRMNELDFGVEISESTILQSVYGMLGIRDFTPSATAQYKWLRIRKLVEESEGGIPKKEKREKSK